jgi:hypothetical protein
VKLLLQQHRVVGVVGSEAAKFTVETELKARRIIRRVIKGTKLVVSGKCHLGGIDVWAIEEAHRMGIATVEKPALSLNWSEGYKPRNMAIAEASDRVVCITVPSYPPGYTGMRFVFCYHCKTNEHIKSGGCWTVKYAQSIGKQGEVIVV